MNVTDWLTHSVRGFLPSPWLEMALAVMSIVCGAVLGLERQRRDKPAGLRTLILFCLGSTVFTMISFVFTSTTGDSGRVAAQIVTGVGFLGAGAILHSGAGVSGMTTAATIWLTAGIGMAVGAGYPATGFSLSVLARAVLAVVYQWEVRGLGGMTSATVEVAFDEDHGKTWIRLERIREEFSVTERLYVREGPPDTLVRMRIDLRLPRRHLREFLGQVADLPSVKEIREVPSTSTAVRAKPLRE
jgi:putative Mg2+ transporter-C (MgtC) family protein